MVAFSSVFLLLLPLLATAQDGIESVDTSDDLVRTAGAGHSTIAAGRQPDSNPTKFTPYPGLGVEEEDMMLEFPSQPVPPTQNVSPVQPPTQALEEVEAYIQFRLAQGGGGNNGGECDLSRYSDCTCANPAEFTDDGRGNCNLGVTKPDLQVWCYVSDEFGSPTEVCPDARPSSTRPGMFWSRFACITE